MKTKLGTDKAISEMMSASFGKNMAVRDKYIFREALRGLVRLAKSEQMMEMKANVRKLTGITAAGHYAKNNQHFGTASGGLQQQFEFNRFD